MNFHDTPLIDRAARWHQFTTLSVRLIVRDFEQLEQWGRLEELLDKIVAGDIDGVSGTDLKARRWANASLRRQRLQRLRKLKDWIESLPDGHQEFIRMAETTMTPAMIKKLELFRETLWWEVINFGFVHGRKEDPDHEFFLAHATSWFEVRAGDSADRGANG